ncbi:MAG: TetR/AcrR family transcriptional regulator [Flavobacteriales bacterium]|nr:TetR/AcrR family transcriptional regulator [Flavobacteriales bacterium]MCB9364479.1 TetR/AcrR family transcriptional regulator [Flavobacteriales bacterium]
MEAATQRIDKYGIQELTIKSLAADINLSEAALYRHFKGKNEIMLGLLNYFILGMKERLNVLMQNTNQPSADVLKSIFNNQLNTFMKNPAIISVIFSEGIFQFNKDLANKVSSMMNLMQANIEKVVKKGQEDGDFNTLLSTSSITTIIMGSMRMVVLKWKLSGHKSDLIKDGNSVLNGLLKMLEK